MDFFQLVLLIFLTTVIFQSLFYLVLSIAFLRHKTKLLPPKEDQEPVSVVICSRNRLGSLRPLLLRLMEQNHREYEVIVVDDRSRDGTEDFFKKEFGRKDNFKLVSIERLPDHINAKKFALTMGIKAASYDKILLTDADCLPNSENWISGMLAHYEEDTEFVLGYSGYTKLGGILNYFVRFETVLTGLHYIGLALLGMPYMGVGRNLSYKKSFFLSRKGFSGIEALTGGDDDLFINRWANRQNTEVAMGSEVLVLSEPKNTWKDFYRQKIRHLKIGRKYKVRHKIPLALVSLSQILFWLCFINLAIATREPYIVFGGFLIRFVAMVSAIGIASARFKDKISLLPLIGADLVYTLYYVMVGVKALFTKKVNWA